MLWPVIFLMLVLLLACAAAVPGITRASTLPNSIMTMECGVAMAFDDILNGNITSDNSSYFLGINTLVTYLGYFSTNITTIINDFQTNLSALVGTLNGNLTGVQTDLGMLSNGTTANTSFSLIYTTPVPGAGSVASSFGTVLGYVGDGSTTNVIGILTAIVNPLASAIGTINSAIGSLNSQSGTITSGIDTAKDSVAQYGTLIANLDTSIGANFGSSGLLGQVLDIMKSAFLGYYAAVIGLAVLALIGVIIMACFDKAGCRYLMYVACVIMLFVCIIGFLLATVLSLFIPILYMGCSVLNPALDSSASFLNTTSTLNLAPDITSKVSICLPGGSGAILNEMGSAGANINSQIDNVKNTMVNIQSYGNYDLTPLNNAIANVGTVIDDFIFARQNDISYDATSLAWFKTVANGSYAACSGNAAYLADSLVPSSGTASLALIPCATGSVTPATNTSCASSTTAFGNTATCTAGCIDLDNAMIAATSLANFNTNIDTRYTASSACSTALQADFTINYNNWYVPRIDTTNGIGSVQARWTAGAAAKFTNIVADLGLVKPKMLATYNNLNSTINSLVDPNYGMVAGINCLLIGEDLKTMKNTICVTLFNSLYFLFMTVGTASFALLFSMCCIVCSGVRHFKQSEMKNHGKPLANEGSTIGMGMNNQGMMQPGYPGAYPPAKGYY